MKIRTNEGPVELTAEMVCKGMAFQDAAFDTPNVFDDDPSLYRDREVGVREVQEALAADVAAGSVIFLGCAPEFASRADCERFGVYGDAAAHGFARLRDGGAVDLRREAPRGSVAMTPDGFRLIAKHEAAPIADSDDLLGLNADHASPEDVKRMCCGAWGTIEAGAPPLAYTPRCTLAIGEHEQHEDLATGAKWATSSGPAIAKANIRARLDSAKGHFFTGSPDSIRRVLAACDLRADVHRLVPGSYRVTLEGADAVLCDAVGRWLSDNCPAHVRYEVVSMAAESTRCNTCGCHGDCPWRTHAKVDQCAIQCGACGCRWCGPRKVIASPKPSCGKCAQAITDPFLLRFVADRGDGTLESALICTRCAREIEPSAMTVRNGRIVPRFGPSNVDSMPEARATKAVFADGGNDSIETGAVRGFCAFVAGLKRWAESPEGKRASQERALVALVDAVPEGLDPIGWRAAVLACHESYARLKNYAPHPEEWGVLAAVRGCPTGREGTWKRAAEDAAAAAYHRAITPAAPVPRVRATWKTRGHVLAVDDGRDE